MKEKEVESIPQKGASMAGFYDLVEVLVQALVIIFLLFAFVFRVAGVSGDSMNPTLENKNWLILSNIGFRAQRGDIVVISQPNAFGEPLIKRIVATEGEVVNINTRGEVVVDGKILEESYIAEKIVNRGNITFPHEVPDGHVFVMGDNRNHSSDSRFDDVGDIDVNYIVGKAEGRLVPFGHWGIYN